MLHYDFEESIGYWVVMTAHAMQRALRAELRPYGITYRQWQVLAWLAIEGPLSQADLAERMMLEPATLVSVLGRMERRGWVRRAGCSDDRRKRLVFPTPRARTVWEKGVACARRVRARAAQGLSRRELAQLKRLLARVRASLEAELPVEEAV
jgi:MarR family transcriptional regulator for hemolysin